MVAKKKILITGGNGFIGKNLRDVLNLNNHYLVSVIDKNKNKNLNLSGNFYEYDINDTDKIKKIFKKYNIVIHLAAESGVRTDEKKSKKMIQTNINGTFDILNILKDSTNFEKLIFASSGGAIIGNGKLPYLEDSPARPVSLYGSTKLAGEALCSSFSQTFNMQYIALRFANVYGPNSATKNNLIPNLFKNLIDKKNTYIYGNGNQKRDFIYVDDVCNAINKAITYNKSQIFNIGNGKSIAIKDIIKKISLITNQNIKISYKNPNLNEVVNAYLNINKTKKLLNFQPEIKINCGLINTYEWYKEHYPPQ